MKILLFYLVVLCALILQACQQKNEASLILHNAIFLTMDSNHHDVEFMAVSEGRIVALGSKTEMKSWSGPSTQKIDLAGKFVMPGLIEGHGHFEGVGESVRKLNFLQDSLWLDIVKKVEGQIEHSKEGEWIVGRGWHQEKLKDLPINTISGYPYHDELSRISPDHPVLLVHASGHALMANKKAMEIAQISPETSDPVGGHILRDHENKLVGVFEERAMSFIREAFQEELSKKSEKELEEDWLKTMRAAQNECLKYGITSFQDAGSSDLYIKKYASHALAGNFEIRLWTMLRQPWTELKEMDLSSYPYIDVADGFFTCRAIKSELDGALGSYGAWLLKPYDDKPNFHGQNTTTVSDVKSISEICLQKEMQLCVHAIGDRANRIVIDLYHSALNNDQSRWRIEHAQHLDPEDIPRFREKNIIASIQGVHCTSDAPFVVKRLGVERARNGAYPWRSLLDNGVKIANGTDAPVESLNPFESIYASVTRKRMDSGLEFFPEQSMTRMEALKSYTYDNAYAAFEESKKGTLSVGKYADFIVLDTDLLNCSDEEILETHVLITFIDGEMRYEKAQSSSK